MSACALRARAVFAVLLVLLYAAVIGSAVFLLVRGAIERGRAGRSVVTAEAKDGKAAEEVAAVESGADLMLGSDAGLVLSVRLNPLQALAIDHATGAFDEVDNRVVSADNRTIRRIDLAQRSTLLDDILAYPDAGLGRVGRDNVFFASRLTVAGSDRQEQSGRGHAERSGLHERRVAE